ncbi:hypothetical protein Cs7R123_64030 [Catellatospora sp. TT07R-123]|nr:hypothetical protein Cs7R123_64030 [Catellatospora sp. TT07R-123]
MAQLRLSAGLSQSRLALLIKVSKRQVINYEKGRHTPTPAKLKALAEALSTTAQQLVGTPPGHETLSDLRRFAGMDREEAATRMARLLPGAWAWRLQRLEVGEAVATWPSSASPPQVVAALAEVYQVPKAVVLSAWKRTSATPSDAGETPTEAGSQDARSKAARDWDGLNERQRVYLKIFFHQDRAAEREAKATHAAGRRPVPPSVWRKLPFSIKADPAFTGYTPIQQALRTDGQHDAGAGATVHALAHRGLVEVSEDQVEVFPLGFVPRVLVELTRAGRACARYGLDELPEPRDRDGLLSDWLWQNLVKVAAAGINGLAEDGLWGKARFFLGTGYRPNGSPSRGYIDLVPVKQATEAGTYVRAYRWHLTDAGRTHIDQHFPTYRRLYPAVHDGSEPLWS